MISRNQIVRFSSGTASERDLRLPRLPALLHRHKIRLSILRYHMILISCTFRMVLSCSGLVYASIAMANIAVTGGAVRWKSTKVLIHLGPQNQNLAETASCTTEAFILSWRKSFTSKRNNQVVLLRIVSDDPLFDPETKLTSKRHNAMPSSPLSSSYSPAYPFIVLSVGYTQDDYIFF